MFTKTKSDRMKSFMFDRRKPTGGDNGMSGIRKSLRLQACMDSSHSVSCCDARA